MLVELAPGGSGWPKTARPGNQEHALECRMCSATRCERNFGEKMVEGLWWVKMGEDESFSGEFPFDLPLQIKLDVYYLFLRFFWRLSFFQVFFYSNTVDGQNPAPVELGSLSHDLRRVLAPSQTGGWPWGFQPPMVALAIPPGATQSTVASPILVSSMWIQDPSWRVRIPQRYDTLGGDGKICWMFFCRKMGRKMEENKMQRCNL